MSEQLRAALGDQRLYAAYSKHRTHGVHINKDDACREYVIGECFIMAALAATPSTPEPGIDVERLLRIEKAAALVAWLGASAGVGDPTDRALDGLREALIGSAEYARLASKDR